MSMNKAENTRFLVKESIKIYNVGTRANSQKPYALSAPRSNSKPKVCYQGNSSSPGKSSFNPVSNYVKCISYIGPVFNISLVNTGGPSTESLIVNKKAFGSKSTIHTQKKDNLIPLAGAIKQLKGDEDDDMMKDEKEEAESGVETVRKVSWTKLKITIIVSEICINIRTENKKLKSR